MTVREELVVPGGPPAVSHYTDAVRFGDLLHVSGMVALTPDGEVVGKGDVTAQARYVHELLGRTFGLVGASFADVLKVTVYLTDIDDRQAVNEVRKEFFGAAKPASTLVQVSALVLPELLVEIEAVVGIPS
ncbi:RidA family protein [Pseudonocardia benzenivorans]|jgi:2-iminobutanoate/2-iminopropanoate deaminase|uniref:Endoribonuclease L-PSP n=2 Tax=Pseudonocardia TaxID=1847 RepID=F4CLV5_PSEUX|nr:RidA family protein [Pseudonocardia dioxanivorans]AEA28237.1 Endoribonuclease L-PSP [Pseudonocardia dioxanivorans CB1190]GJF02811.1 translation initiation inhibitor [Pseudonocardia sp. D17]